MTDDDAPHWYALRVQPQKEFVVAYLLRQRGADTYVPTELRARRRNRYVRGTDEMAYPVLPGIVFAGFEGEPPWYEVTRNTLVLGAIGYDGEPWRLDLVELLWWRARIPDGCLVLHRARDSSRAMRLVRIEGRGVYRSPHERPHFISARRRDKLEVVPPTRRQADWLTPLVMRQPEPVRAAA